VGDTSAAQRLEDVNEWQREKITREGGPAEEGESRSWAQVEGLAFDVIIF
jgi:hypothetical protein